MRLLWIVLLIALTVQANAVVGVHGNDDRTLQRSDTYPWSAVARFNNVLGGWCTAVVVGPKVALTAAHCLWNKTMQRDFPPCALHFLAGYAGGEYGFHSLVVGFHKLPRVGAKQGLSRDWALLYLQDDPVPVTGLIPLHDGVVSKGFNVSQAGYSKDRRHRLSTDRDCRITARNGALLQHDCDATFGDSGSPLLLKLDDRWFVAGVHVAASRRAGVAVAVEAARNAMLTRPHPGGQIDRC